MVEGVATHGLITAAIHILERLRRTKFLKYRVWRPNADMRVVFVAMLRHGESGKYVLVRNFHRPQTFGPLGGVYKYFDAARSEFDRVLFRPEDTGPDMTNDLRGYLPRKNLSWIDKWFRRRVDRESPSECLRRELGEELKEIGLSTRLVVPTSLQFRHVRTVSEGPVKATGRPCLQYRVFEVFEPIYTSSSALTFFNNLTAAAATHPDLLLATSDEVLSRRVRDGRSPGPQAAYLVGRRRVSADDPPFLSMTGKPRV